MAKAGEGAERPRERLLAHGATPLASTELLALLLRTGARGRSALQLAEALIAEGLGAIAQASPGELAAIAGIGPAKAASVLAALELGRRLAATPLQRGERIASPEDVHRHFHARLRDAKAEEFHTVLLDARHRVLRSVLTSQGTLTASLVHPREVFRPALREAAAALVLVHNHPSGDPTPSSEDREITRRLARAGALLGIPVLDHVIVADRGYASLREHGDLAPRGDARVGGRPRESSRPIAGEAREPRRSREAEAGGAGHGAPEGAAVPATPRTQWATRPHGPPAGSSAGPREPRSRP